MVWGGSRARAVIVIERKLRDLSECQPERFRSDICRAPNFKDERELASQ